MYTISAEEQATRNEMFSNQLNAPKTVTLTIASPLAELIAQAMIEYTQKRNNYPLDAQTYYHQQIMELRRQMNSAFPVTYNED